MHRIAVLVVETVANGRYLKDCQYAIEFIVLLGLIRREVNSKLHTSTVLVILLVVYTCVWSADDSPSCSPTPANVSHKSFLAAAQNEKLRERQALEAGLMFARDRLIEMIPVKLASQLSNYLIIANLLRDRNFNFGGSVGVYENILFASTVSPIMCTCG